MDERRMRNEIFALLTGVRSDCKTPVEKAIATRFNEIKDKLSQHQGHYLYNGNRCSPTQLGWRFLQSFRMSQVKEPAPEDILSGKHDKEIEQTWHEAASAEWWYAYEKDWGKD